MSKSINQRLRELEEIQDRIIAGEFPQPTPLGPGQIASQNIRARAVTAPRINVANLEAVNTQTGDLSVDGTITISTAGKLVSGTSTSDWTTFTTSPGGGLGYYLEYHSTYGARMAVGDFNNNTGHYLKWDGSALAIKGVLVASSGAIAGWFITSDSIEYSDGTVGLASSGHSGYAIWAGDSTPANAEFSVTSAGALVATSATITGAITASSGSITGLLNVSGGLNMNGASSSIRAGKASFGSASSGFYLSGGTAPTLDIGDSSNYVRWNGISLTVLGILNATSGNFNGDVIINSGGALRSGQSAYGAGTGFWLGSVAGTPKLSIGNSSTGKGLTWDGTTFSVVGDVTADTGTLVNLTIGGTLTINTSGKIISSGGSYGSSGIFLGRDAGAYKFSLGNKLTFDGTNLSVSGAITATSGSFSGSVTASSLTITGTASFSGGSMTLPGGGSITSSTFDVNSGTMGGLTVDGTITVGSGGKIAFGASAADYLDNNILHFTTSTTEQGKIRMQRSGTNRHAIFYSFDDGSDVYGTIGVTEAAPTTDYTAIVFNSSIDFQSNGITTIQSVNAALTTVDTILVDATSDIIRITAGTVRVSGQLRFDSTDFTAAGSYYGRIPITYNGLTKYIHVFNA